MVSTIMRDANRTKLETPLRSGFYERDKHELAIGLLGRDVVRRVDGQLRAGRIVETEVYGGPDDPASHGDSGQPTARTEAMFGTPGTAYIYLIYGIYYCLNVVAPARQKAAAILIRAAEPLCGRRKMADARGLLDGADDEITESIEGNLLSGPGKICQALGVDDHLDGSSLQSDRLWIAPGRPLLERAGREGIETTPRIGLNPETCGEAAEWPWRYVDSESEFVSR